MNIIDLSRRVVAVSFPAPLKIHAKAASAVPSHLHHALTLRHASSTCCTGVWCMGAPVRAAAICGEHPALRPAAAVPGCSGEAAAKAGGAVAECAGRHVRVRWVLLSACCSSTVSFVCAVASVLGHLQSSWTRCHAPRIYLKVCMAWCVAHTPLGSAMACRATPSVTD